MIDYIIIALVAAVMLFVIVRGVKRAKSKEGPSCGCSCGGCSSSSRCHEEHQK